MAHGLEKNYSPRRRRSGRTRSPLSSCSPPGARSPASPTPPDVYQPQPYMKQIKLHPSGCQQWSSQIVAGGGIYMAYASTLTTYVYDVRDFSLVTILGGNDCNVHSLLWHPHNPHRLLVLRINGLGTQWDVRSEERILEFKVGASPACSAWDPTDHSNLAVISKGTNETYLLRKGDRGTGGFRKGYSRRTADESVSSTCTQWSKYKPGVLVTGWTDGRVSFSEVSAGDGKGKTKLVFPSSEGGAVVDIRHDPHGGAYVLIGYSSGSVLLWDAADHCSMTTFERCAVGLTGIRWMAWASGNFLALSSKTGVARIFNISQKNSIGTVRLGNTGSGVRDMAWLPAQPEAVENSTRAKSTGPRAICGFRDGSVSVADTAFHGRAGGVGGSGKNGGGSGAIPWTSKAGHVETIFACAHKPEDPDTLATGSYGSSVKVWHVPTMDLKVTLSGQTGAIYSLAWSADGRRIASTSGEGTVWIWDAESGRAEQRLRLHSRASHRAQWDPFNKTRLASTGADGSLVIFSEQGTVERVYAHPGALFGCDWCPGHVNIIATGCQDRNVRVFDVSSAAASEPQYILSGHLQRVFHVCWSPLLHGTLASGSDDSSIIVWCLEPGALPRPNPGGACRTLSPSAVLKGHTSNVRPLHWNSEVPWLLLSGSWDGTVRAWDIRRAGIGQTRGSTAGGAAQPLDATGSGACIAVMNDHVADVYGLSAAPDRPFLYASVSRDTTLRQFTLEGVVSSVKTRAVVGNTLAGSLGNIREAMLPDSPTSLCGGASRLLEAKLCSLRQSKGLSSVEASRELFNFFWGSDGIDTFWEMVRWVMASAARASNPVAAATAPQKPCTREERSGVRTGATGWDGSVSTDIESTPTCLREAPRGLMVLEERVVHRHARRASNQAMANLLKSSPAFIVQDRKLSKLDRVERASRLHVATGDLRSSCEALVGLGRWERALALAPGVGLEYWRALSGRYVDVLLAGENARDNGGDTGGDGGLDATALVTALLVSTGRAAEAIDALEGSEEALTLAVTVADGAVPPPATSESSHEQSFPPEKNDVWEDGDRRLERKQTERRTANIIHPEDGAEAKLLGAQNDASTEYGNGGHGGVPRSRGGFGEATSTNEEGKTSLKEVLQIERRREWGEHRSPPESARRLLPLEGEFKGGMSTTLGCSSPHILADSHDCEQTMLAAQCDYGEAMLHSITRLRAEVFFRASQPALAASAVLSVCDGTRSMAAPAVSFLLRGEEPELAYSAARALRFPARELRPLVREMARRAEAWGDPNLSAELLLNAGGDDDVVSRGYSSGGGNTGETLRDQGDLKAEASDGGYWPADVYGTCGEEAGPRGAVMVTSRARSAKDAPPCPSVKLRSRKSYLEEAAAAGSRGMDTEAIRLLVLGGDLEHAAERGASFLRTFVSALSFPTRSLKTASAVLRALGNGSGLCSLSNRVSTILRAEILAYSSYIGALEAMARGYHPVVTSLLRNASNCVQAATRLSGKLTEQERTDADAKGGPDQDGSCSPARRRRRRRKSPRWVSDFPPCMSVGALALAAIEHIMAWSSGQGNPHSVEAWVGPRCTREAALRIAHQIRNEENLSGTYAKAVDDLLLSVERGAVVATQRMSIPNAGKPITTSPAPVGSSEAKCRDDDGDDDVYEKSDGSRTAFSTRNEEDIVSCERVPTSTGGASSSSSSSSPWRDDYLDIVVSGSRLPSCRRHERVAWRTQQKTEAPRRRDSIARRRESLAGYPPPSTASPEFGQGNRPPVRGATFLLEDGETAMGLSDAVMWAKVNPFSPLNTGSRIMPF